MLKNASPQSYPSILCISIGNSSMWQMKVYLIDTSQIPRMKSFLYHLTRVYRCVGRILCPKLGETRHLKLPTIIKVGALPNGLMSLAVFFVARDMVTWETDFKKGFTMDPIIHIGRLRPIPMLQHDISIKTKEAYSIAPLVFEEMSFWIEKVWDYLNHPIPGKKNFSPQRFFF